MDIPEHLNVLLLGSGGREHALAWKIRQSDFCGKLFMAPGNPGMEMLGVCLPFQAGDTEQIANTIRHENIDVVICGPEDPLANGLQDNLQNLGVLDQCIFVGPGKSGARLEGSKFFAKQFMQRHGIPTASYAQFSADQAEEAVEYISNRPLPIVLKADGLAAGKGVIIAESYNEAIEELRAMLTGKFGEAGNTVVIESFLKGTEFSVFILTDGRHYYMLPQAKDYKRIGEADTGLNTGGMGSISPVPLADEEMMEKVVSRIIKPTLHGLEKENIPYFGFIFFGLISVEGEPYVIEYNCRMGDPETESVMPRIQGDLLAAIHQLGHGQFSSLLLTETKEHAASVILVSGGYPEAYQKGKPISIPGLSSDYLLFHMGTAMNNDQLVTSGGRVLSVTCTAENYRDALKKAYLLAEKISFEGKYYRTDLGFDLP